MCAAITKQLAEARTLAQQALDELMRQNNHFEMHLPVDDVRIAIRFLELAQERIATAYAQPGRPPAEG